MQFSGVELVENNSQVPKLVMVVVATVDPAVVIVVVVVDC